MKYLVTFRKHFAADGEADEDPKSKIDPGDGVVEEVELAETMEPAGMGVAGDLNDGSGSEDGNDNGFLDFGSESWVYTIADGHEKEFTDTLRESGVVLAFEEMLDEAPTT